MLSKKRAYERDAEKYGRMKAVSNEIENTTNKKIATEEIALAYNNSYYFVTDRHDEFRSKSFFLHFHSSRNLQW